MDFLTITPLEHVQRKITDTYMGLLDRVDILAFLQREQYWIKKLKTIAPFGLNKRREIPLPFHLLYNLVTKQLILKNLLKTSMKNSDYKDLAPSSDINLFLHTKEIKSSKNAYISILKTIYLITGPVQSPL